MAGQRSQRSPPGTEGVTSMQRKPTERGLDGSLNRVAAHIDGVREKVAQLAPEDRAELEDKMAVSFEEHFAFQNAQARAHVTGKLTTDEAQTVYIALGEVGSASNGG